MELSSIDVTTMFTVNHQTGLQYNYTILLLFYQRSCPVVLLNDDTIWTRQLDLYIYLVFSLLQNSLIWG